MKIFGATINKGPDWDTNTKDIIKKVNKRMILLTKIKKSRIRETKHLSTDTDSITDTKKILLVRQNSPKKTICFWRGDFTSFISKSFQI